MGIFTKLRSSHLKYLFFLSELPSSVRVLKFIYEMVVTADGVCNILFWQSRGCRDYSNAQFFLPPRTSKAAYKANAEEESGFLGSSNPAAITEGHLHLRKLAASWSTQVPLSATACASQLFQCLLVLNYAHKNDWPSRDLISQSLKTEKYRCRQSSIFEPLR